METEDKQKPAYYGKLSKVLATLLTIAALLAGQNAWAYSDVTLSEDPDIPEGTPGHYYVNMQSHQSLSLALTEEHLTTCGYTFKVYDDGGKNGNNIISTVNGLHINVPNGFAFLVTGTLWTKHDPNNVYLRFYKEEAFPIGNKWYSDTDGEPKIIGPVTCDGNGMFIRFQASEGTQYAGFDLTVTVVDVNTNYTVSTNNPTHGTLDVDKSTAKLGEMVTVTPTPNTDFGTAEVSYTACSTKFVIAPENDVYSFKMPACDVSVDAVFMNDVMVLWGGVDVDGSAEHPYVISNQAGWNLLVTKTAGQEGLYFTNGKYFELATDISGVTQSVESFGGHLDGKGHTITLAMGLDGVGLIGHIRSASSISNLTVDGSIVNPLSTVGGFVAHDAYAVTFTNCRCSVAITSSYTGNDPFFGGGFVGNASTNGNVFDRCVFDGSFSSSNNNLSFFPWIGGNAGCSVTNSAYFFNGMAGFHNNTTEAPAYLLTLTDGATLSSNNN